MRIPVVFMLQSIIYGLYLTLLEIGRNAGLFSGYPYFTYELVFKAGVRCTIMIFKKWIAGSYTLIYTHMCIQLLLIPKNAPYRLYILLQISKFSKYHLFIEYSVLSRALCEHLTEKIL